MTKEESSQHIQRAANEVLNPQWTEEMVNHCTKEEIAMTLNNRNDIIKCLKAELDENDKSLTDALEMLKLLRVEYSNLAYSNWLKDESLPKSGSDLVDRAGIIINKHSR